MTELIEFILDGEVAPTEVEQFLAGDFSVTHAESYRATLRFHDTFDWRLYRAGWVLEESSLKSTSNVRCYNRDNGASVQIPIKGRLRTLSDLGAAADQLALNGRLGLRELMPLAELPIRVSEIRLLNEDEKTVARCLIEQTGSRGNGDTFTAVRLFGYRGYEPECMQAQRRLTQATGVAPVECALLQRSMQTVGATIGGFDAKPRVELAAGATAIEWMCAICSHLLEVMQRNEFGIVDDIDSEFLHDFRVAVRRTRSALGQIRGVFTEQSLDHYKQEFAWLGEITSPPRDYDVFVLKFDELCRDVPDELRTGLTGFHDYLRRQRSSERRKLLRHLKSKRYRRLVSDWSSFLSDPPTEARGPSADEPAHTIARRDTRRVLKRVLKQGRSIDDDSPAESLHDLRKSCKKLRYLLEFFAPMHAAPDSEHLVRRLKQLQDNLGDFQDGCVQVQELHAMAGKIALDERDTLLAIGALVQRAADHGTEARREFEARFKRFDTKSTARLFRHLFDTGADT